MDKKLINKTKSYVSFVLKREKSWGKPIIRNIEPTNACMMNCVMCMRKNMKRKIGFMDLDLFKKVIDQAKWNSHLALHLAGDPLIHPKIIEMIEYCGEKGIKVWMSVNPNLIDEKMAKRLLKSPLHLITISLDSVDDKTYKKLRGKAANYNDAVKKINRLAELKKELNSKVIINLSMIKMKGNKKDAEKFKEIWTKEGVDTVSIVQFRTFDGSDKEILNQGDEETFSENFKNKIEICSEPWSELTVLYDGRVVPCCYDFDAKYVLGDLKNESLESIWNNEKMRELRRQFIEGKIHTNKLCGSCVDRWKINNIFSRVKHILKKSN